HGLVSGPPASSSSTRYLPLSLSLAATGQPAEPAPVTMKSYVSTALLVTIAPWFVELGLVELGLVELGLVELGLVESRCRDDRQCAHGPGRGRYRGSTLIRTTH